MKKSLITPLRMMLAAGILCSLFVNAQNNIPVKKEKEQPAFIRCGQIEYENYLRSQDPNFDNKRAEMEKAIQEKTVTSTRNEKARLSGNLQTLPLYTIPIVFHVVYQTAAQNVTDAKVQSMLTQLNQDWSRTNADAGNTPAVWQPIAADMQIQFCLATKDPSGAPTTGIIHKSTSVASFTSNDAVKSTAQGGDDPWNVNQYLNVWICNLGGGLLGYGTFPPVSPSYGTVIHYCTVGSLTNPGACFPYNHGRTLSHEIGHCFALYHIWGNVSSGCTGSDLVSDTPNMDGPTSGCPSGVVTTPGCAAGSDGSPASNVSPGRMYQNYMDYTDDLCYNMFTTGQKNRCQAAITQYLTSLANNAIVACGPAAALDAGVSAVIAPNSIACNTTITPIVTLRNYGSATLTSCTINYRIDANPNQTYNWTGSLATGISTSVTLPVMTTTAGTHTFTAFSSSPNAGTDGNPANDQSTSTFTIASAQNPPIIEGIESATFPPAGWTLGNPDGLTTWARTTVAAKTGAASMYMDNFNYNANGQIDDMISPPVNLTGAPSPTLTFQLAYQLYTNPTAVPNFSDTLEVQMSTDCGTTWNSIYKKYGASGPNQLTTVTPSFSTVSFVPTATQWRLELVPLAASPTVLVKLRSITDYENQLYVDDINITSVVGVDETSLDNYVSIFPNPSSANVFVFVNAMNLGKVNVKLYNIIGEAISEKTESVSSPKKFQFNLANQPGGIYFVEVKSENAKTVKKVVINK